MTNQIRRSYKNVFVAVVARVIEVEPEFGSTKSIVCCRSLTIAPTLRDVSAPNFDN